MKIYQFGLIRGKLRRLYLSHFRKKYIEQQIRIRKGACLRCGACCNLVVKCHFLKKLDKGVWSCKIHDKISLNCSNFPIDEKDLRERDLVMPDKPCGFYFDKP